MTLKQRQLNPIEATAYWWINNIKYKVRELHYNNKNIQELEFYNLFYRYTDLEWRKLYIFLVESLKKKVNDYISLNDDNNSYQQGTEITCHDDINEILSSFLKNNVPDICLALKGVGNSFIYTNNYGADRVFADNGISSLDDAYGSNYILSGDKEEFEVKTLIMLLLKSFNSNTSFEKLKQLFIDIYLGMHPEKDIFSVIDEFIKIFNQMCDDNMILSTSYEKVYKSKLSDFDLISLESDDVTPLASKVKEYCNQNK
ncbi:MAG: hypothetical protein IJR82_01980 [Bacilli bacterium]|nr:hypothetical protein [Bacilli bacterium]